MRWYSLGGAVLSLSLLSASLWALPPGFQDTVVISGLTRPTTVRFAPDGRIFVAEKSGIIKVFDNESDVTATVFADFRSQVFDIGNSGFMSLAVDPAFPTRPYIYVMYAHDAVIGGTSPLWNDTCDNEDGALLGCTVSGRLSRLTVTGNVMTGPEEVLIEDWCQQYPIHSLGDVAFGPDGALYLSAGDGATATRVDYGQVVNSCGNPPLEGGGLESLDLMSPGDPITLNGTFLRVDPDTGNALPDNPLFGGAISGDDRIIAYGLRNPFRFAIHPTRGDIWISDVGWITWEEFDWIPNPTDSVVENFGWPCYEGFAVQPGYAAANLPLCNALYASGAAVPPYYVSLHQSGSALTGIRFYTGGNYPAAYQGALFVADYPRRIISVFFPGTNGLPDPLGATTFDANIGLVDLQTGPSGDLYYADIQTGTVHRIRYFAANQPPFAVIAANPTNGLTPLAVNFDGSSSSDPNPGDTITLTWDLDGDGVCDDATGAQAAQTYTAPGAYTVKLCVTDNHGAQTTASVLIQANNRAPVATIITPISGTTFRVGDIVTFLGSADDPDTGPLPDAALHWELLLNHCHHDDPTDCHLHFEQNFPGVSTGQFIGIDHEFPAFLELLLTATELPPANWWDTAWSARSRLTVNSGAVTSLLSDFPVLVLLDATRVDYARTQPGGGDLRFITASGSLLDYEIETWNPAGMSAVWVRLPAVGPGSGNDFFWMYYGNPLAAPGQNASAVWTSSFAGVWHMGPALADSTLNANHGVNHGTVTAPGRIGDARSFNGVNAYVDAGMGASLNLTAALTAEAWVKITNPNLSKYLRIISNREISPLTGGYSFEYNPAKDVLLSETNGSDFARATGVALDTNWHYVAVAINGTTARFYLDGTDVTFDSTLTAINPSALSLFIGARADLIGTFAGNLDEVRLSGAVRSAAWISAQHRAMSDLLLTIAQHEFLAPLSTTAVRRLDPETSPITFDTAPSGLDLVVYSETHTTPFERDAFVGGLMTIAAPSPQFLGNVEYQFSSWSDGGAASHDITVGDTPMALTAVFAEVGPAPCTMDSQCQDGRFCNGAESCVAGICAAGAAPVCGDAIACTTDVCDDGLNSCTHTPMPALCDDALFCNGTEACDALIGCISGAAPCSLGETCDETNDVCVADLGTEFWMVFGDSADIPGVGVVENEDIVAYDLTLNTWALIFDGSDVGLASYAVDALAVLPGGDLALSFTGPAVLPGLVGGPAGTGVDDSDIVRFTPTTLGSTTAGGFTFYFDGSDVGLTTDYEDVDGIAFAPDGRLIFSLLNQFQVVGLTGGGEDLVVFNSTSLGSVTTGTFALYLDGSALGLLAGVGRVDAAAIAPSGIIFLSTSGDTSLPGLSVGGEDAFQFIPTTLGNNAAGSFAAFLDLSTLGINPGENMTALERIR